MGSWEVPSSGPNGDKKGKKITYKKNVGADNFPMDKKVWGSNQVFILKYEVYGFVKR